MGKNLDTWAETSTLNSIQTKLKELKLERDQSYVQLLNSIDAFFKNGDVPSTETKELRSLKTAYEELRLEKKELEKLVTANSLKSEDDEKSMVAKLNEEKQLLSERYSLLLAWKENAEVKWEEKITVHKKLKFSYKKLHSLDTKLNSKNKLLQKQISKLEAEVAELKAAEKAEANELATNQKIEAIELEKANDLAAKTLSELSQEIADMEKKRKEMAEDCKTAEGRLQEIQQQVIRAEETKISEARKASEMEGKCKNCNEELAEAKSRLQTLKEEVNLLLESKFSERKLLEKVADEYKKIMGRTEKVKKEFNQVEVKHKSEICRLEQQYQ